MEESEVEQYFNERRINTNTLKVSEMSKVINLIGSSHIHICKEHITKRIKLKDYGLSDRDLCIAHIHIFFPTASQSSLAEVFNVNQSTISRILKKVKSLY